MRFVTVATNKWRSNGTVGGISIIILRVEWFADLGVESGCIAAGWQEVCVLWCIRKFHGGSAERNVGGVCKIRVPVVGCVLARRRWVQRNTRNMVHIVEGRVSGIIVRGASVTSG
jgi:hypothetical protein